MYDASQEVIVYVVAGGLFIIVVDYLLKKFNLV
jgi:preprotein translocase subunit SecE